MPHRNYLGVVQSVIEKTPALSSLITDALIKEFGIKKAYGRKLLSSFVRDGKIFPSYPFLFDNGQYAYSIRPGCHQFISMLSYKPMFKNVFDVFSKERFIMKINALKLSGALDISGSDYYDSEKLFKDLNYFFPDIQIGKIQQAEFFFRQLDQKEVNKKFDHELIQRSFDVRFFPVIMNYAQQTILISNKPHFSSISSPFKGCEMRQNVPFDATAFSGIGNSNKEATAVVFDIKICELYRSIDFQGFLWRVEKLIHSIKSQKYKQRIIPIIVAANFEEGLYDKIKKDTRFMALNINFIFGSRIKEFLEISQLSQYGSLYEVRKTLEIIDNAGLVDQLFNFFPFVFESLVGEMLSKFFASHGIEHDMFHSKKVRNKNMYKEFDIWFENEKEIIAVECKFHKKDRIKWEQYSKDGKISADCCKYFFEDKHEFLKKCKLSKKITMIFVSANDYDFDVKKQAPSIDPKIRHPLVFPMITATNLLGLLKKQCISSKDYKVWLEKYFIRKNEEVVTL